MCKFEWLLKYNRIDKDKSFVFLRRYRNYFSRRTDDKVNIMERDPESTSVTINVFQNLTQYIISHWPWSFEKNLWSGTYISKRTGVFDHDIKT